jgi:YMGG-like Gly-zipper
MMSMTKTVALFLTSVVTVALGWSMAFAQAPATTAAPAPAGPMKPAALGLAVYPGSGQDATQQAKDEGECYTWARQQTGIDPTVAATPAPVADAPKGGAVKGAARGAARGAAVGAVGDDDYRRDEGNLDAGEGAAAGAAVGAAKGRRAQKKAGKQAEAQATQAASAEDATRKDTFKKAWGACLEGKGYSVK